MKYGKFGEQPCLDYPRTCVDSKFHGIDATAAPDTALVTGTASVTGIGSVATPSADWSYPCQVTMRMNWLCVKISGPKCLGIFEMNLYIFIVWGRPISGTSTAVFSNTISKGAKGIEKHCKDEWY